ncbi:MAG TPA: HAD family acid phosphatase [Thermoanaerobaculia bacterium]|nr:HAD family acid phosphatase [Thermoanaerobaculia bacterium]
MRRLIPLLLLSFACKTTPVATTPPPAAQAAPVCNAGHTLLNAALWVRSSAEFRGASMQTFGAARRALDEALADKTRTGALEETNDDPNQPPAIVLDLDETTLDNTEFEARVIAAGMTYDEKMWKQWTSEGSAPAMPGATEFLQYADSRGVAVFYVTNRDEDERAGTVASIRKAGLPFADDRLLLRADPKASDKSGRRKAVADRYRLLLLAGDDLNDFANMRAATWAERDAFVKKMESWWGTRWFVIPNPMYGSFENAAIGSGGTPCERAQRKVDALKK